MVVTRKLVDSFLAVEGEHISNYSIPWKKRLWCYRHGFLSISAILYGLDRDNVHRYLSDLQRRKAVQINDRTRRLSQEKVAFHLLLAHSHADCLPKLITGLHDGELNPLPSIEPPAETIEELLDGLDTGSTLIAKPTGGWHGSGIFSIGRTAVGFTVDGEPISRAELLARLASLDDYLLGRYVEQAAYSDTIYPDAVNTLRIVTMVDPDSREAFVPSVVHRFGTDASRPVDNWSAGGVCAAVDVETGRLGPATPKPSSTSLEYVDDHPNTGARITGTTVPAWDTVRDTVCSVADEYAYFWRYLGWDVVVTDDGGSISIIEANAVPDVDLMQVHEPLLADPRVERFFRHHDVL